LIVDPLVLVCIVAGIWLVCLLAVLLLT